MANGGRKSLPRRILEAADAFASSFSDAELKLFGAFGALLGGKALKRGRYRALTRRRIQRELARVVDNICAALEEEAAQAARQALLTAYAATAETIADEIEAFAVQTEVEAERAQREMIKIVDELTRLVNESTQIELKHMRRDADDIYRQIVEKVRDAWLEPKNASKLNAEVQEAIREFAASGVTGFTDKAGRKWGLYEYANMAMRTAIHRAGLQATIDTMRAKGQDLAYVTRHPGACPLCARWYGVILSLSGDDPTHPSLQGAMDQGLFHPNCADVLQPYIPGVSDLTAGMGKYTPEESAARYTASQHQRALEREIRKWKRMQAASTTPENERMCKAHIDKLQRQLRTLTGETKLPRRYDREGGRVLLSADAKKLKPFTIDENGRIMKLPDVKIMHAVGAKNINDDVLDLSTGERFQIAPGSRITNVEVFAGKGVNTPYRKANVYAEKYGGSISDWQHVKGFAVILYYDEERKAEIHWSRCEGIGNVDRFIKRWLDES